jgi:phosphoribosylaminoimidazole (AIR) synthetase
MTRTFNLGVGLVAAVPAARADEALAGAGLGAFVVGEAVEGTGKVHLVGEPRW